MNGVATVTVSFGSLLSINHIIYMLQENRSFDHYFGQLPTYLKNSGYPQTVDGEPANASNPGVKGGAAVSAFHLTTQCVQNLSPRRITRPS
jgi:phospholipase C